MKRRGITNISHWCWKGALFLFLVLALTLGLGVIKTSSVNADPVCNRIANPPSFEYAYCWCPDHLTQCWWECTVTYYTITCNLEGEQESCDDWIWAKVYNGPCTKLPPCCGGVADCEMSENPPADAGKFCYMFCVEDCD